MPLSALKYGCTDVERLLSLCMEHAYISSVVTDSWAFSAGPQVPTLCENTTKKKDHQHVPSI